MVEIKKQNKWQDEATDVITGWIKWILIIILFILFIWMDDRLDNIESPIDDIEQIIQSPIKAEQNLLDGWVEECVNHKIISHYIYVQNDTTECDGTCGGRGLSFYHSIGEKPVDGYSLEHIWNETICIKKMLVKHTSE